MYLFVGTAASLIIRYKTLEAENSSLKEAVADLEGEKAMALRDYDSVAASVSY